jgi:flagellar biosynthesis protein FlhB
VARLRRVLHILLVAILAVFVLAGDLDSIFTLRSLAIQPTLSHLVSFLGQTSAWVILLFILRANLMMLWPPAFRAR